MDCTRHAALRQSSKLIVFIVCMAWIFDKMILTSLAPFLPDLLHKLFHQNDNNKSHVFSSSSGSPNTSERNTTVSAETKFAGIILAIQPLTETIFAVTCGSFIFKLGYRFPLLLGSAFNLFGTLGMSFANSFYLVLFCQFARSVGSSFSIIAGMSIMANIFKESDQRMCATSIALIGETLGTLVGNGLSSVVYDFCGQEILFLGLSALCFLDFVIRLVPKYDIHTGCGNSNAETGEKEMNSNCSGNVLPQLLKDPYVILVLAINVLLRIDVGMDVAVVPAWLLDTFQVKPWKIGLLLALPAFLQMSERLILALLSLTTRIMYWVCCIVAAIFTGLGLVTYPICETFWSVLGPESFIRVGSALMTSTVSPLLAYLVDVRHSSTDGENNYMYAGVYSLFVISYNMGTMSGQLLGGLLYELVGFKWLYWTAAILTLLCALLSGICYKIPRRHAGYQTL